jgi:hypothetical protein
MCIKVSETSIKLVKSRSNIILMNQLDKNELSKQENYSYEITILKHDNQKD